MRRTVLYIGRLDHHDYKSIYIYIFSQFILINFFFFFFSWGSDHHYRHERQRSCNSTNQGHRVTGTVIRGYHHHHGGSQWSWPGRWRDGHLQHIEPSGPTCLNRSQYWWVCWFFKHLRSRDFLSLLVCKLMEMNAPRHVNIKQRRDFPLFLVSGNSYWTCWMSSSRKVTHYDCLVIWHYTFFELVKTGNG